MEEFKEWEYEYKNVEEIIEKGEELKVIKGCDFEIAINKDKTLSLIDLQGGNLGDIESEVFENYEEILYRLEPTYLHDFCYVWRY